MDPRISRGRRRSRLRWSRRAAVGLGVVALAGVTGGVAALGLVSSGHPGPQGDGTAVTPTGWKVTPVGRQIALGERPYGLTRSPDGRTLLVSNDGVNEQALMVLDAATGAVRQTIRYPAPEALFLGVAYSPDGQHAYASAGANDEIHAYEVAADGSLSEDEAISLATFDDNGDRIHPFPAGLAVSPDNATLYVADHFDNALSIVDLSSGDETRVPLSDRTCDTSGLGDASNGQDCLFPYGVTLSEDGATAYVSDWGQDAVSVVDTAAGALVKTITVGTHPSALALSPTRPELYVADTESDAISVIDTNSNRVIRTTHLHPYGGAPVGTSPNALAVRPDGRRLYVADAGNNDLTVLSLGRRADKRLGYIPTGWYPTGVLLDPTGSRLFVANAKGLGAGPNPGGPVPGKDPESGPDQYIGSMINGTLSIIDAPRTAAQLRPLTEKVIANDGFADRAAVRGAGAPQHVVPRVVGAPSPIKHAIYIVNENRTYDQVLGDLKGANGDPRLTLFGPAVTPNHHALAQRFTTLDNVYAAGEVSEDGWEWSTGANASTLDQKTWPTNYGGRGHFYVGEGGTLAAAPGKDPSESYIWDALDRAHLSYRNYGFWASDTPPVRVLNEPNLDAHTDHAYAGFNMAIPDQDRFAEWLKEFRGYVAHGNLPSVEFLKFPRDHTCGTSPDCPTPKAMVADSDWALGKLVDAVSHSRYWSSTAIFVIEDDAQDGPDHVDAHRTVGHVISPYTQTGKVDSTFYSSVSMLRTIELIFGLQPLTQFDAAATPLSPSFTDRRNDARYDAIRPEQSLTEPNPANAPLAAASRGMDFRGEDRAPEQTLNRAIWQSVRGAHSRMPAPRHGLHTRQQQDDADG
jgi:YVTN family beta-propeller protein